MRLNPRRRDIVRKTRNGLDAARNRGRTGGRPRVVDADKHRIIIARHLDGESIRTIASATKLSIGTVHATLTDHHATSGSNSARHHGLSVQSCSVTTKTP